MNARTGTRSRPAWLPPLAAIVLVPALASLGFWQLDRAAEKRAIMERFRQAGEETVALEALPPGSAPRYQRVRVTGTFDVRYQFLLDSMTYRGVAGYQVLGILLPEGGGPRLLVNRGWIAAGADRSRLPAPEVPVGKLDLTGRMDLLPRPGMDLGAAVEETESGWPRRVLYPSMADLEAMLPFPLYPGQMLLDDGAPGGFVRDWRVVNSQPERHVAYAVQWFAMSAAVLAIFFIVRMKQGRNE